mgnify:CR=1 FL=1
MNAYKSREELLDRVLSESCTAEFIFGCGLDPGDLPDGTPHDVTDAVTRLAGQAAADMKTFRDWLYSAPEDDEAPA